MTRERRPPERAEGQVFWSSTGKQLLFALLMLGVGLFGVFLIVGRWTEGLLSITGIVFALLGFGLFPFLLILAFVKHGLVIGDDCLQFITGKGEVTAHVPYANIARVGIRKSENERFIGIDLEDVNDPATVLDEGSPADSTRQLYGCDVVIINHYGRPLPDVRDDLRDAIEDWRARKD
jgi:hypothetical protein